MEGEEGGQEAGIMEADSCKAAEAESFRFGFRTVHRSEIESGTSIERNGQPAQRDLFPDDPGGKGRGGEVSQEIPTVHA